MVCGNALINSIYDLRHYDAPEGCNGEGVEASVIVLEPVDCTNHGGYSESDPCKQTCVTQAKKTACYTDCRKSINFLVQLPRYEECLDKCDGITKPTVDTESSDCPEVFVDCTKRGGYDPTDKCKQTCNDDTDLSTPEAC